MATLISLTNKQSLMKEETKIVHLLQSGFTGRFYPDYLPSKGNYTRADLIKPCYLLTVSYGAVKKLAAKGLITFQAESANKGTFVLSSAQLVEA